MAIGAEADTVTVLVRITLPFLIAVPLGLFWFTRLERLEASYQQLLADAAELARRASVDPLTGLLNRRSFIEQFNLSQNHGIAGIFILADVDDLKLINDELGHLAGDEAIVAVAEALRGRLGDKALIARIGGDEFCAFSPCSHDSARDFDIDAISEAATSIFRSRLGDDTVDLGISIGTVRTSKGLEFTDAIAASDANLYRNKAARKGSQPVSS
ncbi:GGDEF domain-containing protein [Devosia sp. SD17-2]|nr:GGDEF domain-containing protein [Devosia sp. SD17-2]